MRVLVTLLASLILALGILGAGLTLLHTIPRKHKVTDPGLELVNPADLDVRPEPIAPRSKPGVPREASFRKSTKGELQLRGRIQLPGEAEIGIKLMREDAQTGLFLRRATLGKQREFRFEGLTRGKYRLQVHEAATGHVLIETSVRLSSNRNLELSPQVTDLSRELQFSPQEGSLQSGAILVLENDLFFHQRIPGEAKGKFLTRGLPAGPLRYTIRGRLDPKTTNLLWKGEITVFAATKQDSLTPMKISLSAPEKDPLD